MDSHTWLLIVLLVICAIVSAPTSVPRPSDENIYFLMARDVLRGSVPYRDFFFAHPPIMLLVITSSFMLFGTTWVVGTAVATVVNMLLLVVCFHIGRRQFGARAGLLACAVLLSSPLFLSSAETSGNALALLFAMAALERHLARRPVAAGLFCGIAVLTKLFAVVAFPVILFDLRFRRGAAIRFLLPFLAVTIPVAIVFANISGIHEMLTQTVLFHMKKEPFPLAVRGRVLWDFLWLNALVVVAALPSLIDRKRQRLGAFPGFLALVIILILVQRRIFLQYLLFPLIPLAVFAGASLDRWISRGRGATALVVTVLVAAFLWNAPYSMAVRSDHPFGRVLIEYAKHVRVHSNPDERVFGHAIAAPTLAFLSDRRISGNEIDTNYVRVTSGVISLERFIEAVTGDLTRYVVLVAKRNERPDGEVHLHFAGIGNDPAFRRFVLDEYIRRGEGLNFGEYDVVMLFENKDMIPAEELARAGMEPTRS